jgi:hypothetical protein
MLSGEKRRGERREAGCKLTASLGIRTKNFVRETCGLYINSEELTIIWVG